MFSKYIYNFVVFEDSIEMRVLNLNTQKKIRWKEFQIFFL